MKNIRAKKLIKRISAFAASMVILLGSSLVASADAKYTYSYDYWGDVQDSPDAYEVLCMFDSLALGMPELVEQIFGGEAGEELLEELEEEAEEEGGEEAEEEAEEESEEEAEEGGEGSEEGGEGSEEGGEGSGEGGEGEAEEKDTHKAKLDSITIYNNEYCSLTLNGKYIYVCDPGNNRIIKIERISKDQMKAVDIIYKITGDVKVKTFDHPADIQFGEDGCIYVADMYHGRILKLDENWNYIMEFNKPNDQTLAEGLQFRPHRIAVDSAGRVYCISKNINKGLVKYEADGTFSGFVGATPVVYDFWDYLYKRFATEAQKERLENFVPTEYHSICMDHDGFIYAITCVDNTKEAELKSGSVQAVRRLNLMGSDILIRNGEFPPYGDLYMGNGGPSQIVDATAFDNDCYVLSDRNRGRLFLYDEQGHMLFAFGGKGNVKGYFKDGVQSLSVDHDGYDLLVFDSSASSITIFTPTEYGSMIFQAMDEFDAGNYELSGQLWQNIMDVNGNYDLAYIGVGRALLRQGKYKEAMEYFELKYDDSNYSKAFKQYRKEWVEKHILTIFILAFAVLIIPMIISKIGKIKYEIDTADIFKF